ncbi:MAG: polyprenyl synthetase family protein, partial [Pseudomonadales bacterium]
CLGLAFQIQDDILDTVGTEEVLGKQAGADLRQAKSTYVGLLGLEGAKSALSETTARARAALTEAQLLTNSFDRLIQFVAERDH